MTRTDALTRGLADFEHALAARDVVAAVDVVEELLDDGADAVTVALDIIAAAQRRVGERWLRGEWSVAQEHAATGISASALEAIARRVSRKAAPRGRIVLACAEREWHTLPALLVATGLREHGWDVTCLGASTPADRLASYLHDVDPHVAAVSCSVVGALPNSRRFIEAGTGAGIPVLAGGSAFGPDARRAEALGATAWAPSLRAAADVLDALPAVVSPAPPLPAGLLAEQRVLELEHHARTESLRGHWRPEDTLGPDTTGHDEVAAIAKDCVQHVLYAVQAALLTGDGRLVRDAAEWIGAALTARGAPASVTSALGDELAHELRGRERAVTLVRRYWPR